MSPGGGSGQPLAQLVVEFVQKGQEALGQSLDALKAQTDKVAAGLDQLGQQLAASMQQAQAQTQQTVGAVNRLATVTVQGAKLMAGGLSAVGAAVGQLGAKLDALSGHAQAATKATAGAVDRLHASVNQHAADMQMAIGAVVLAVNKLTLAVTSSAQKTKEKTAEAKKPVDDLGASFTHLGQMVNVALGAGVASIGGFIRQGMALSVTGQIMQIHMERLALAMSGLFRPEINKVIQGIERLTSWLANLSDRQREHIAGWLKAGAAALVMGLALPRVFAGVQALIGGFRALGAAISGSLASTGIGALLPLIGLAVQGITMLLVGTEGGRAALARMGEACARLGRVLGDLAEKLHLQDALEGVGAGIGVLVDATAEWVKQLTKAIELLDKITAGKGSTLLGDAIKASITPFGGMLNQDTKKKKPPDRSSDLHRAGGFENIEDTYRRVALAASKVGSAGKSPEEKTADNTEPVPGILERIWEELKRGKPIHAR